MGSLMSSVLGVWFDLTIKAELFIVVISFLAFKISSLMPNIKQLQRRQMGK